MSEKARDESQAAVSAEPSGELDSLLRAPSARLPAAPTAAVCLGRIVALDAQGAATVEFPGSAGALPARRVLTAPGTTSGGAITVGQEVVLTFENGDPTLPLILGCIERPARAAAPVASDTVASGGELQVIEADVDGKRVHIVAQDEIVLQCGNASITLRRNGRIVIRGTYVESYSEGTNRIKGGQVRIN